LFYQVLVLSKLERFLYFPLLLLAAVAVVVQVILYIACSMLHVAFRMHKEVVSHKIPNEWLWRDDGYLITGSQNLNKLSRLNSKSCPF